MNKKAYFKGLMISTVRLPLGLAELGYAYETMVFRQGSWNDLYCDRYASEDAAEEGHSRACRLVLTGGVS